MALQAQPWKFFAVTKLICPILEFMFSMCFKPIERLGLDVLFWDAYWDKVGMDYQSQT